MYIAVCEDEQAFIDEMLRAIQDWAGRRKYRDVYVKVYLSADELWDDWESGKVLHALFLDIEFPYMSGFTLAQKVRQTDLNIPIIFVTNTDSYLQRGYEVSAFRYLKKPPLPADLDLCLDYCYRYTALIAQEGFVISRKGLTMRMPYHDVLYIVSWMHTATIVTTQGQEVRIPLHTSFEKYAMEFPAEYFIRCHRSYIINIAHALKYTQSAITLVGAQEIPVGGNYREQALEMLRRYFYCESRARGNRNPNASGPRTPRLPGPRP
jgi:DNA-binding LytR/AlgR family response regulator